jgi:hypothetical protein
MMKYQLLSVSLALASVAGSASAQRWGGSATSTDKHGAPPPAAHEASAGGSWNGTASKWGGSPVVTPAAMHARTAYQIPLNAYFPVAETAPVQVPVTYVVDTVYVAAAQSPVDMQVVTSRRAPAQQTTMDVYRQQRFGKP